MLVTLFIELDIYSMPTAFLANYFKIRFIFTFVQKHENIYVEFILKSVSFHLLTTLSSKILI
jgi:hypothetical protein